jgi:SET domain-containing protein
MFEVRASPIQGLGAFATRRIPAGTRLIEYAGERITPAESDRRYPDQPDERHHTFLFAIDDEVVITVAVSLVATRVARSSRGISKYVSG